MNINQLLYKIQNQKFLFVANLLKKISKRLLFISSAVLFVFITSCSPQSKYKVLTIFFDDVPLPDSSKIIKKDTLKTAAIDTVPEKTTPPVSPEITHPPAEEGGCVNCHDVNNSFKLVEKQPALCYNCHNDYSKKLAVLHGPLNLGSCSDCHEPHRSRIQKFLKLDGQSLCYFCHTKEAVLKNDIHSGIENTKCWDCHNPHGGSDRTFLK